MSAPLLFACSKCFSRHPFEELSAGQQLCKITELKAKHFTVENEFRNKIKNVEKDHENKVEVLNARIQNLLKEVASLSKSTKRDRVAAARESSNNSGSGTDSPSTQ
ncbi:hypothetical protein MML48_3g00017757 [Holotrichia oblita]|uniref:Uncharacterized protein n=1 Tax=Holotrichia oblita TaxID=644536 RepID=A0ACB9TCY9_HOLOL|nr:hypothetical protein MML48_3g00017757 [Holotrichia oblita]